MRTHKISLLCIAAWLAIPFVLLALAGWVLPTGVSAVNPPILTVTWPTSGQNWEVGTDRPIQWTSSGVTNVKIEYSTDGGSSWSTVIASTPSDGAYTWTVPSTPSTQCRVKISDAADGTPSDLNDGDFTIFTSITVDVPNGGEVWGAGEPRFIAWHGSHPSSSPVKIEYSTDGGTSWSSVVASTPNDGSYQWTVPSTPSTQCRVRISGAATGTPSDVSDNDFTITQRGNIIVEKQTEPDGNPTIFTFSGDASGSIGDGQELVEPVLPGSYSSTETVPNGWNLTDITCDDPTGDSSGDTATGTATFNVAAGETVRCTFTNSKRGSIIVEKQTSPDGAPAASPSAATLPAPSPTAGRSW